ncbi:MAG TPA: SRPBCC domain-containing protein, partial [Kamptonema sp.]|nr:SRPBCC domain-containing protein [Kamptonema sp.]
MPSLHTEIEIDAPKYKVWRVLFHKEHWVKWNSFLFDRDSSVPFKYGQEVMLSVLRSYAEDETEFQPLVTVVQPDVCLVWVSAIPGFRSQNVFELEEVGIGRTRYIHKENFSGLLTGVFLPFIREDEQRGMERMARELKRYAER